jgi:hypothetical protein
MESKTGNLGLFRNASCFGMIRQCNYAGFWIEPCRGQALRG